MVNEFVPHSPKKQDDSNDEDGYFRESTEKPPVSDSSDEDTVSSSLLPIPDTLNDIRNELKSTINNLCATDYEESPKSNDFNLNELELSMKHPTEKEVAIAEKITSANILLNDLISSQNKEQVEMNPLAFRTSQAKERLQVNPEVFNRLRSRPAGSETPTSGSSSAYTRGSSAECCRSITVTPFVLPNPTRERSCCPCERNNILGVQADYPEPEIPQNVLTYTDIQETDPLYARKSREYQIRKKKCFLASKVKWMRFKCRRKKKGKPERQGENSSYYKSFEHQHDEKQSSQQTMYPHLNLHSGLNILIPECKTKRCKCLDQHSQYPTIKETSKERKPVENADKTESEPQRIKMLEPNSEHPKPLPVKTRKMSERIDIYYFDHGNSAYYRTTDSHPARVTEHVIERANEYATMFWAEVFGTVTIGITFVISFLLQLYRCLFTALIRALTVGIIQIFSDYFFKPFLTVLFNGLIQPCMIFGYNIATSAKDFCIPICEIFELCAKDVAIILGSCRLVDIKKNTCSSPSCHCDQAV